MYLQILKMKVISLCIMLIAVSSCSCYKIKEINYASRQSQNKTLREVETYTTIILEGESFSIISVAKNPENLLSLMSRKNKENNSLKIRTRSPKSHHFKENKFKKRKTTRTSHNLTLSPTNSHPSKEIYFKEKYSTINIHKHREQTSSQTKKKITKRQFEGSKLIFPKIRREYIYQSEPTLTPFPVRPQLVFDAKPLNSSYNKLQSQTSWNPVSNSGYLNSRRNAVEPFVYVSSPAKLQLSNSKRDSFPNQDDNQSYSGDHDDASQKYYAPWLYEPTAKRSFTNDKRFDISTEHPSTKTSVTTTSYSSKLYQTETADIVERNLPVFPYQSKVRAEEKEDRLGTDE